MPILCGGKMENKCGFEIERKFLIEYPDTKKLCSIEGCKVMKISQSYIEGGLRIRRVQQEGKTVYIKTIKKHITDIKREEREWEIGEEEYFLELEKKAVGTSTIEKTRYAVPFKNFIFEIDVFDFWNDRAFAEIELNSENEQFTLPDFIKVIKEVTFDRRYRNSALAKKIITEEII